MDPVVTSALLLGLIANAVVLIGWLILPSESRVKSSADKYSRQLMQAADSIASSGTDT